MTTTRFSRRSVTKAFFVPSIASAALIPTAAEVNAGTKVSGEISELNGFTFANSPITTPNLEDAFTPQIPGEDTAAESSILFYERRGGTDTVHDAQPKGTAGYMVFFPRGIAGATPAAADKADVFPVTIGSNARQYTAANEAARYNVVYEITAVPAADVTLT